MDIEEDMRREVARANMDNTKTESRPESILQALMQAPPNADPEESQEELEERMRLWVGPLAAALDALDERERTIVQQVVLLGRSYRAVARDLSLNPRTVYDMLHGRSSGKFPQEGALNKLRTAIERKTEIEGITFNDRD